ncbi:hypothetical protein ElyMa_001734400 [Elysia marginata]|uniref:Uncharacterized protein n=1 Tax=Elysia marginata TaxID=1093978 RepID=A0AAV4JVV2_9GAST|nr:hypothetical protein ElyMa_001734400 [Elysia marginata]
MQFLSSVLTGRAARFHASTTCHSPPCSLRDRPERSYRYKEFQDANQRIGETTLEWAGCFFLLASCVFHSPSRPRMTQMETEEVIQRFCTGSLDREAGLHAAYKHPQTLSEAVAYIDHFQRSRDAVYCTTNCHEVDGYTPSRINYAVDSKQKYDSHRFFRNRDHAQEPPRDEIYHHNYRSPDPLREDHLSGDSYYSQEPLGFDQEKTKHLYSRAKIEISVQESSSPKVKLPQNHQASETERERTDLVSSPANCHNSEVVSRDDLMSILIKSSRQFDYRHENVINELTTTPSGQNQIESFEVSQDLPNCTLNGQLNHDDCERYNILGFQALKSDEEKVNRYTEVKQEQTSNTARDKEMNDIPTRTLAISIKDVPDRVKNMESKTVIKSGFSRPQLVDSYHKLVEKVCWNGLDPPDADAQIVRKGWARKIQRNGLDPPEKGH